ncbi:MAG: cytochrome C oxidase subunit IV family protein [Gammaproteobacteria bacterium]|nr:cytochrome C oxidase subunit IV family protein [Gammaproteobacteria bacterium]
MIKIGHTEKIWLILIGLTILGATLAEAGHAGWPLTLTVAFLIGFKAIMVVDHYMEMRLANRRIRRTLLVFIVLIILMVFISQGFGNVVRSLLTIN